jgi:hypothetical protein
VRPPGRRRLPLRRNGRGARDRCRRSRLQSGRHPSWCRGCASIS